MFHLFMSAAPTLSEAFGTALTNIQTSVNGYIGQALPIGLGIMGTILAITIGVKAVKRFSH